MAIIQDPTDQQLIDRCRQGRPDAWRQVLARYERLVFSIPLNYGLARADAADVAQLTFTTLVEHLERLRPDSNLGGWLALGAGGAVLGGCLGVGLAVGEWLAARVENQAPATNGGSRPALTAEED